MLSLDEPDLVSLFMSAGLYGNVVNSVATISVWNIQLVTSCELPLFCLFLCSLDLLGSGLLPFFDTCVTLDFSSS
ncbi:uncharacterized protein EI90DRAFT_3068327 [Cantharellus anzutake]|uniref:uncharacterized protein n=1 Tax=Cantharellus anzutake TaxID=1750568 RepID=UPI0019034374|nr:uncharacterized protein EI90DRAFT_3068327 [Cantharellus anzutake]KAF8327219.1 hypothetical protein EI90DRAFT_3068327 [Cantharellus anzutake]